MDQMVSEYRVLRSSVLRLWLAQQRVDDEHDVQDIIRFNEAIDQALVEWIARYGEAVESTRKTVLGVLGHDLRSPLGALLMASDMLRKNANMTDRDRRLAELINASVSRANHMVGYLLDWLAPILARAYQ
jgi:signal transduction histidine kinase